MNESTDLQLERLCTVNRKATPSPSWEYSAVALRNLNQVSLETSAHQFGAALLVQHPGGHCVFDQIDVLLVLANFLEKIHSQTQYEFIFSKLNCWGIARLLCKPCTSLFGCPCHL